MLANLAVVLFKPNLSENVGSAARAMANMGASELILVEPQNFDLGRAKALATPKGHAILDGLRLAANLPQALAPFQTVIATTARTGGWRKAVAMPEACAAALAPALLQGRRTALVFGPEDKGLTNDEIVHCGQLVTIPTDDAASSLNLAQAVLIVLYEMRKACLAERYPASVPLRAATISHAEREALQATIQETLTLIDFLHGDNPDYFMQPVRALVERLDPTRPEFDLLMGVCRQMKWAAKRRS